MEIHLVSPYWAPFVGGAEVVAEETVAVLSKTHHITVHTSNHSNTARLKAGLTTDYPSGTRIIRYATPNNYPIFRPKLGGADLVHFHGFYRPLVLFAAVQKFQGPLVVQPQNNLSHLLGRQSPSWQFLRRTFDNDVFRLLRAKFAGFICLSNREVSVLESMGIDPRYCTVIPGPLRLTMLEALQDFGKFGDRDPDLFVVSSRLVPQKHIEHAILAVARVPRIRLAIAGAQGDREYSQSLRNLTKELKISDRVEFKGLLSPYELQKLYKNAVGSILASRSEGWPLSIAESILFGSIPIGTTEAVSHLTESMSLPLLYDWGNIDALSARISEVRDNAESIAPDLEFAKSWITDNLSPELVAKKVEDFYIKILDS